MSNKPADVGFRLTAELRHSTARRELCEVLERLARLHNDDASQLFPATTYDSIRICSVTYVRIAFSSISTPRPGSFGMAICPFSNRKDTFA